MSDTSAGTSRQDYSFGQIALREELCSFAQVKECLDIQNRLRSLGMEPQKLGDILIGKGYLGPEQAAQVARLQAQAAQPQRISIPGYEILSKIGQGDLGGVYKARQVSMDRLVAIKILSPKYARDEAFVRRFTREARAAASLKHENVITGIDAGEVSGIPYFVMEYVDGTALSAMLKRKKRLEERRCVEIAIQVARALDHAHRHGMVHRDVKPENIMIASDGGVKLCDLGQARWVASDANSTWCEGGLAAPHYVSPEQARGEGPVDIRADLYALGATLYHMSTGRPPFMAPDPMRVLTRHLNDAPESPRQRNPALSQEFSDLILRLLRKQPGERPPDPRTLVTELEALGRRKEIRVAAAPRPALSAPVAPPSPRPPITRIARARAAGAERRSSSGAPIFIGVFLVLAAVGVFLVLPKLRRVSAHPATPAAAPRPAPPPGEGGEIREFRAWADALQAGSSPTRFTEPYARIEERIKHHARTSRLDLRKAWMDEREAYVVKVNDLIGETVWEPIRKRSEAHYGAGRLAEALEELRKLDDVHVWLRREVPAVKTEAGKAHEALVARISTDLGEAYVTGKSEADHLFRDRSTRDQAYARLDVLAAGGTPEQKREIEAARGEYFGRDLEELLAGATDPGRFDKAEARLRALRASHAGNPAAGAALDKLGADLTRRRKAVGE